MGAAVVALAVAAVALVTVIPGLTSSAGATVGNPGNVKISMTLSVLTPTLTLSGISTTEPARATVQRNGWFVVPRANIAFAPTSVDFATSGPIPGSATVQLVAMSDVLGVVNPATNVVDMVGNFEEFWSQTATMTDCPVGPFAVHLSTQLPSATPYAQQTGTATMVDDNFAIDVVPANTPGCAGLESALNATLSLPVTTTTTTTGASTTTTTVPVGTAPAIPPPVPGVVMSTTFSPAPQAPTRQPPATTVPQPTTTTSPRPVATPATTTPTTAAPVQSPAKVPAPSADHKQHHSKSGTNPHKKRHPKRRAIANVNAPGSGPAAVTALPVGSASGASSPAAIAARRRGFIAAALERRANQLRALQARRQPSKTGAVLQTTAIDAELASSLRPTGSLRLDLLLIVVVAPLIWFAVSLIRSELLVAAAPRRGRLFGIDPRRDNG